MKFAGVIVLVTLIGAPALGRFSKYTLRSHTDQPGGNVGSSGSTSSGSGILYPVVTNPVLGTLIGGL